MITIKCTCGSEIDKKDAAWRVDAGVLIQVKAKCPSCKKVYEDCIDILKRDIQ